MHNLQGKDVGFHCFIGFLNFPRLYNCFILLGTSSHSVYKKCLEIVYPPHFVYNFSIKIFLNLSFYSSSFHTWSKCEDKNLNILRMKRVFKVKPFFSLKNYFEDIHCVMYKSSNSLVYVFVFNGQFFQITLAEYAL